MTYYVNLSIGEFHLVFESLQNRKISNELAMKNLFTYSDDTFELYPEVSDPEKYKALEVENEKISALLTRLYEDTNKQLGIDNSGN